jgi:hypothetical protein
VPTFSIDVSYHQFAVFDAALDKPFSNWSQDHVSQGFAWRPGSVAFRTLSNGPMKVVVAMRGLDGDPEPIRVIRVPFAVPTAGLVEVASISDSQQLEIPAGSYSLTFEHGATEQGAMWCRLSFEFTLEETAAAIIRADSELTPPTPLVMTAEPA